MKRQTSAYSTRGSKGGYKILTFLVFLFFFSLTKSVCGQSNIDTVIIRYLRTLKGIPSPELSITTQNGRAVRSANYFLSPLEVIKSFDIEFRTFLFGSNSSHEKKYFLIQVLRKKIAVNKIIDSSTFKDGQSEVLLFLKNYNISDEKKSLIIKQLIVAYR
jgi:hypothetical protein